MKRGQKIFVTSCVLGLIGFALSGYIAISTGESRWILAGLASALLVPMIGGHWMLKELDEEINRRYLEEMERRREQKEQWDKLVKKLLEEE